LARARSSMNSDQFGTRNMNLRPSQTQAQALPSQNPNMANPPTDPAVIHAITQTMIGEFVYKYTMKAIGKGYGEKRHERFFWVHPYTRTLYWSSVDPGVLAYVEGVRSVLDPNPMPPGLYQYSVVVSTPQREMKFTAPTKERHDLWLNALKYLLSRPNPASPGNIPRVPESPLSGTEFEEGSPRRYQDANTKGYDDTSPQSQRSRRSTKGEHTIPRGQRSRSQLSFRGSVGKRSSPAAEYLRWNGVPDSPYSPTRSFMELQSQNGDGFVELQGRGGDEDLDFELHDEEGEEGLEGLENVRACCDRKHTVGHHHHHGGPGSIGPGTGNDSRPARPVSPGAWSFRSRTGSHTSHDGGGKWRFGSRRSAESPAPAQ
ncbi:meiotic cell cortex C-terminal pleckstrin homology-domain-containing protein, partial [Mycena floridula]